jgi:hypothetical protein
MGIDTDTPGIASQDTRTDDMGNSLSGFLDLLR